MEDAQLLLALQAELAAEKVKEASLQEELKAIRKESVDIQLKVEQEEEFITNRLTKRLEELKLAKESLIRQVEAEEEHVTNTLQAKLRQLTQEKIEIQQQLEQEEEFVVNRLQKQLLQLTNEKNQLAQHLRESSDALLTSLCDGVQRVQAQRINRPTEDQNATKEAMDLVASMTRDLDRVRVAQEQYIRERDQCQRTLGTSFSYVLRFDLLYPSDMKQAQDYEHKLRELDQRNALLEQKMKLEHEKREQMIKHACFAEQDLETTMEREVNIARRHSITNSPVVTSWNTPPLPSFDELGVRHSTRHNSSESTGRSLLHGKSPQNHISD
eukprot:c8284_g1_i1.p1 GENE.c8284_g1_i1~~c8284_g1_i1.p1  ORF type:complete len:336 (-),score=82.55 c8284_g1_i1:940-1920(-)